jgi:hypothetical protein
MSQYDCNPNDTAAPSEEGQLQSGLTKREYFAALALQGMLATPSDLTTQECAEIAVRAADQLIAELNA